MAAALVVSSLVDWVGRMLLVIANGFLTVLIIGVMVERDFGSEQEAIHFLLLALIMKRQIHHRRLRRLYQGQSRYLCGPQLEAES